MDGTFPTIPEYLGGSRPAGTTPPYLPHENPCTVIFYYINGSKIQLFLGHQVTVIRLASLWVRLYNIKEVQNSPGFLLARNIPTHSRMKISQF